MTLVEPLLRRTTFLEEVVGQLELSNVTVVRGRAEALHGVETYDVVTSRAVAPLERLLRWSMPLVSPHGALVAMKGSSVHDEIQAAQDVLSDLRCGVPTVSLLGGDLLDPPTSAVRVAWADPAAVSLPPSSKGPGARRGRPKGPTSTRRRRS